MPGHSGLASGDEDSTWKNAGFLHKPFGAWQLAEAGSASLNSRSEI